MIQKNTIIKPADNCGVIKSKVFHVYKGSKGRLAYMGDFVKTSSRVVKIDNNIKKKSKIKSIIIRTKFLICRKDNSHISFNQNSIILLKKRLTPRGKAIKGPVVRSIKRKKFISSFRKSI